MVDILRKAEEYLAGGPSGKSFSGAFVEEMLAEARRLEAVITEPVEAFSTPELIAWIEDIHKLVQETPESERGQIPFVMGMGCKLEHFAKEWHSPAIKGLSEDRDRWKDEAIGLVAENLARNDPEYSEFKDYRKQAARELETEASEWIRLGKEQREALVNAIQFVLDGTLWKSGDDLARDKEILRSMLTGA